MAPHPVRVRRADVVHTVADHRACPGVESFARDEMSDEQRLVVERAVEIDKQRGSSCHGAVRDCAA